MKVEFGEPNHGWLPVRIETTDFELAFEASDVPLNPISQLAAALRLVVADAILGETLVWWHLEPSGYYFSFARLNEQLELTIWYAENDRAARSLHSRTVGSMDDIMLPFYRAIKRFASYEYNESDWPQLEPGEIRWLRQVVKNPLSWSSAYQWQSGARN
ncbi:hypothetical protein D0N36_00285 [Hymenobacter lapidiphilus]|uniref:hypothetical protein n=1 Tax=Hymenobacter sp. CCM 8763 TaxID=2303334 RepID=UPI000E35224F|nr:hypothetical protein [Hymenobacter sp. CCM 8763]RFP66963.1 hypothetical protein D0N36_00285 [Hymenobacter sp. CCM 8763]